MPRGPSISPLLGGCALVFLLGACAPAPEDLSPSDDPDDYSVDPGVAYEVQIGAPRWIVPSELLPSEVTPLAANNNVEIVLFGGRLLLAWRSAETHFASRNAVMHVISSGDGGETWEVEHKIALGADVREPRFLALGSRLFLHWFEAGTLPTSFDPRRMWRSERLGPGEWTAAETFGTPGEVPWALKRRRGRCHMTSYAGEHHVDRLGEIELRLRVSDDGRAWRPVDPRRLAVYRGGASEAAFEFDERGDLWAVTRNEDGDRTGFGSHLCTAGAQDLSAWTCPERSDPERYDSPWVFRHGRELYLVARRDVGGPFDQGRTDLAFKDRRVKYLLDYSLRPKRTALFRIDRTARRVRWIRDLPSAGDTAFPSVRRTGAHTFLVANYTSPLTDPNRTWLAGQMASDGTRIYLLELSFVQTR